MESQLIEVSSTKQWKRIYLVGGIFALVSFCLTLFDIVYGSITSGDLTALPQTAIEFFSEINQNWVLGLYHLDLVNMVNAIVMFPTFFALLCVHRKSNLPYAAFTLLLVLFGTMIFVSTNVALPMLDLAGKYSSASEENKILFAAAGETLLARGEHGSPGVFIGFITSTLASLSMALVMLDGDIFTRKIAYTGVIGNILLLPYIFLVTFIPEVKRIAVIIAAPGGLLVIVWVLFIGITMLKLGFEKENAE
ncbi:MAG: hypothetical protein ACFFFH_08325 [Candidatus Thorarchaeota archaeon]